jgi:HK97 family phage major capsid protein
MTSLLEDRAARLKAANDVVNGAKAAERELTAEENTLVKKFMDEIDTIDAQLKRGRESKTLMDRLAGIGSGEKSEEEPDPKGTKGARTLGENFVKSGALDEFRKGDGQRTSSAPEFKAATDPFLVGSNGETQYGRVVATPLRRLTIADLIAPGALSASSLTYFAQGAVTGAPAATAEGGTKSSLNFAFSPVVEALSKLTAVTKVSDESIEDTDYIVSVIDSQLTGRLAVTEEDQILNGSGTAPNLKGLLNRSGVQTYGASGDDKSGNLDKIYHGITLVATGSALLPPDGVVINPTDYEGLRLSKDGQDQYYAGGPFTGAYGNGAVQSNPGIWGLPTIVTPAIAAGTVLVGAFGAGAQLFRKGGIRVDSTNSDQDDFVNNRITLRAEERVLMAVYFAAAFAKLTLGTA